MYKITYIDGNDLKYKKYFTEAGNKEDAIADLRKKYEHLGDFDHQFIEIVDCKKMILDKIRSSADKRDYYVSDSEFDLIISMWFPKADVTWEEAAEWNDEDYQDFVDYYI